MNSIQARIHQLQERRNILASRGSHNDRIVAKIDREIRTLQNKLDS